MSIASFVSIDGVYVGPIPWILSIHVTKYDLDMQGKVIDTIGPKRHRNTRDSALPGLTRERPALVGIHRLYEEAH